MNKSNLSIIVPAYNVESYIEDCLNSLRIQSYSDFEVVIVDDGSTDNTKSICDNYEKSDKRFKVFHKKNGGLSDARNFGLNKASGNYITFIDSDDYVSINYVEQLIKLMNDDKVDIGCVSSFYVYDDANYSELVNKELNTDNFKILPCQKAVSMMLKKQVIGHSSTGKVYRRNFLNGFKFPVGKLYEDYLTTYNLFEKANYVAVSSNKIYFYRQRNGSIMHVQKCNEQVLSILDVSDKVTKQVIDNWPSLYEEAVEQQALTYLKTLQRILNDNPNSYKDYQKRIKRFIRKVGKKLLFSSNVDKKTKVKILLCGMGNKIFLYFYNKYDGNSSKDKI